MSKSVQSNSAILVHFTLKLDDGSTAESTRNNGKPALFRLGDTSLSEGLEQQLLGLKEGRKRYFRWSPMLRLAYQARILSSIFPVVNLSTRASRKSARLCSLPQWMAAKCPA
jgi:FKBP-type peptidyl-prolyl cis-trans isomerase SlpA